jgi:flagellar biosynthetic protein FlhB
MRERTNRRMIAAVPRADLVVMNPTHYAVALKYDESTTAAPRVIAKGADLLAMRIRDAANDHKVPVLQAPCWRVPCTRTPKSIARFPPGCSPRWRRCWPTSTSCAPR